MQRALYKYSLTATSGTRLRPDRKFKMNRRKPAVVTVHVTLNVERFVLYVLCFVWALLHR